MHISNTVVISWILESLQVSSNTRTWFWLGTGKDRLKLNAYNYPYWSVFVLYAKLHVGSDTSACQLYSSMFGVCFLLQKYLSYHAAVIPLGLLPMSISFTTKQKIPCVFLWFCEIWKVFWLGKQVILLSRLFFFSLEWKKRRSQETSDMDWDIKARKCKSFDFDQNMHDLAFKKQKRDIHFYCTDMLNTLLFASLIFNFSDCCFISPNPWVNLVVSSACGGNTSDLGPHHLYFLILERL